MHECSALDFQDRENQFKQMNNWINLGYTPYCIDKPDAIVYEGIFQQSTVNSFVTINVKKCDQRRNFDKSIRCASLSEIDKKINTLSINLI